MKSFSIVAALAVIFAFAKAAIELDEGVMVLTDANFEEATTANNKILVEFYAPWCGHCKSLAPEWAKAAKTLADSPVKLAKLDATEHRNAAEKHQIKGFPTIKYFVGGKASEYNGGRTESDIVKWVNKKSGPSYTTLETEDDLLKFEEKNSVVVIGVVSSLTSDAAKGLMAIADEDDDLAYAITTSAALQSKFGVGKEETVVILKSFDEKRNDLSLKAGFDKKTVQEFVLGNSVPLIQTFSQEAAKTIFSSPIQKHVLIFTVKDADHHAPTIEAYRAAADSFKGKLLFVNVPSEENRVLEFFDLKESDLPTMVIGDMSAEGGIKKYPYGGAAESAAISAFLTEFIEGKLSPVLKSEEPAPEDTAGGVVVLKGKSFKELVLDNQKDVFVEFYAPWCGHCKKLAPVWDKLAEKVADNENVVIAKMDSTANEIDVPNVGVRGFPTLYFFKGGKDKNAADYVPAKYEGGRELGPLVTYLKENAHHTVTAEVAAEEEDDHDEL